MPDDGPVWILSNQRLGRRMQVIADENNQIFDQYIALSRT